MIMNMSGRPGISKKYGKRLFVIVALSCSHYREVRSERRGVSHKLGSLDDLLGMRESRKFNLLNLNPDS